ncbi:MAG: methyltransferase [Chloroflexota bacterium]
MIEEIAARVAISRRYRDVDRGLVTRLAGEEAARSRNLDDAVKRVKRRLHQAVGAFEGRQVSLDATRAAYDGSLEEATFRAACRSLLAGHASTAERTDHLEALGAVVHATGAQSLVDLGCGLGPLALPWYGLPRQARITAIDVDGRALAMVGEFLGLIGQPHEVREQDLVADATTSPADVALLLKLVTTLDRQDPMAAERVVRGLRAPRAIVSFPARSLGRGRPLDYHRRMDELLTALGERVVRAEEASVPNELVYVLTLAPTDG